jgi:hypothetical protein
MNTKSTNTRRVDDPEKLIKQRREQIKTNRDPVEKQYLESALEDYCSVIRRLFKLGFIGTSAVSCDRFPHERFESSWRDSEKLGAMKAAFLREQAAKRKQKAA